MKDKNLLAYIIGILTFSAFITYSTAINFFEYIPDSIIFIVLISIIYFFRKSLNLNPISFFLLIIALASHNAGVFGWYNISPLPIQYDHFTHFIGLFSVSLVIFNALKKYFTKNKVTNFLLMLMIFFASLGIGALVEQTEYIGYLQFGTGAGLLKFGGLGDTPGEGDLRQMDIIGGGWINAMTDLNYNFLGALVGIILMYFTNKYKSKKITHPYARKSRRL